MEKLRKKGITGYEFVKYIAKEIKFLRIANYGKPYDKRLGQKYMRALKRCLTRDDYRELYRTIRCYRFGKICHKDDPHRVLLYYYRCKIKKYRSRMKAPIFFILPRVNYCFCEEFKEHRKLRLRPDFCRHTAGVLLAEAYNRFDITYYADKGTFTKLSILRAAGKTVHRNELEQYFI